MNQHVKAYCMAFRALECLHAQGLFQALTQNDLKPNKDVVDSNRIGQSTDNVSWIWRTGKVGQHEQGDTYLQQGKQFPILKCARVHSWPIYQLSKLIGFEPKHVTIDGMKRVLQLGHTWGTPSVTLAQWNSNG
jgi:hypothetical protein